MMRAFAPAKVNLTLAVGPPRADGRHPLDSLVAFADVGDTVALDVTPGLEVAQDHCVEGPFAAGLAGLDPESLSWVAPAGALMARAGRGGRLSWRVEKALPLASGIGGGSADAGAALRLLAQRLGLGWSAQALAAFGAPFGGDLPACVLSRPCLMRDDGAALTPIADFPLLHGLLVNPGVACPTGPVYRAFDALGLGAGFAERAPPPAAVDAAGWTAWIAAGANDLEAPALRLVPAIGEVLARLRADPAVLLARLSGSGATCFALCESAAAARAAAGRIAAARPAWWVVAAAFGDRAVEAQPRG